MPTVTASIASLILTLDDPGRDDLTTVRVWASTTSGFTPGAGNLVYTGDALTIVIANLTPLTTYYLRFAYISEIDPDDFELSTELSGTPNKIDGSIIVDGSITADQISATGLRGKMIAGSNILVKGSQSTAAVSFAGSTTATTFTISLLDTTNFHTSGIAAFYTATSVYTGEIDTLQAPVFFRYTGKTATTLTGCSGFNTTFHRGINIGDPVLALSSGGAYVDTAYTSGNLFVNDERTHIFRLAGGTAISFSPSVVADEFTYTGVTSVGPALTGVSGLVAFTGARYIVDDIGFPRHTAASTTSVTSMTFTSSTTMVGTLFDANGGQCVIIPLAGVAASIVTYTASTSTTITFANSYSVTSGRTYVIIPIVSNELVSDVANGYVSIQNKNYLDWSFSNLGSANSLGTGLEIKNGDLVVGNDNKVTDTSLIVGASGAKTTIRTDTANNRNLIESDDYGAFTTPLTIKASATELTLDDGSFLINSFPYGTTVGAAETLDLYQFKIAANNNGTATLPPNNVLAFIDTDTTSTTNQPIGRMAFVTADATNPGEVAYIECRSESTSAPASLHFATGSATTVADRLSIASSGLANFTNNIGVNAAAPSTSIAINSALTVSVNGTRSGMQNVLTLSPATLTADRTIRAAYNSAVLQYQNSAAFSANAYGAYNEAVTDTTAGNSVNGEGSLTGSLNYALHNTDDATFTRMENAYGAYNYAYSAGNTSLIDQAFGTYSYVRAGGTAASATTAITTAYGVYSLVSASTANRNITTAYAFYAAATETGTITTKYGLYVAPTWANYIAGGLQIGGTASSANTAGLTLGTANMAVPSGSAPLYAARAWVNFNGVPLTGTYSQTGTTVTVTITAHGLTTGQTANLDFTSGTAVDGSYTVTVTGANTFTVTQASRTTSGNVTLQNFIRASGNVSSITDNGTGLYTVNFTTAMPDANYTTQVSGRPTSDLVAFSYIAPTALSGIYTTSAVTIRTATANGPIAADLDIISVAIFR